MMETTYPVTVLIAAPEGIQSSALRTFLGTFPGVQIIARSTSQADALRDLSSCRPNLLLLDCGLNGGEGKTSLSLKALLTQIHASVPGIETIFIANDLRQKQMALAAGVPCVLLKGGYDQSLRQEVERISLSLQLSYSSELHQ